MHFKLNIISYKKLLHIKKHPLYKNFYTVNNYYLTFYKHFMEEYRLLKTLKY